ncbi:MAG: hypothetical protein NTV97_11400 [Alphaproteobacteria bacterium]|nr:hypothetical protein [Alphaproteobacteria bacterium]
MAVSRRTALALGVGITGLGATEALAAVDVSTGLGITAMLDATPPALRVTSIGWFSGFRDSGLKVGDQIVAVDGVPVTKPANAQEAQRTSYKLIGATGENVRWAEARKGPGAKVVLKVRRRATPGQGWRTLDVTGTLQAPDNSRTADNRILLGPKGPPAMYQNDGFDGAWQPWADALAKSASAVLDDPLHALSLSTRYELKQHLDRQARVQLLVSKYPGPFAKAAMQDFEAMLERLEGPAISLPADVLHYRELGEARANEVRQKAQTGWAALQAEIAGQTLAQPFPAVHPVHGDRASVAGKYVVLPPMRNRDWITEAGHTWFVSGGARDGWYFADAEGREAVMMFDALSRYRRLVLPNIAETYELIGQIQEEPAQLVIRERAYFGLKLKPVAGLIGGAMFVDMRKTEGRVARFAGEEIYRQLGAAAPPDSASPVEVLQAMIDALKESDQRLWTSLFAPWSVQWTGDGRVLFNANAVHQPDSYFEEARRRIMERVCEMRPLWTDDVRVVIPGDKYPGQMRLEEVTVEMQHIGRFDDSYRAFVDVTVHRWWKLQRLGMADAAMGPWRITSLQPI